MSYDQYQSLRFRTDHALWANAGLAFRLQFFHGGRSFAEPVRLYEIVDGQAREIVYDPAMFEFDKAGIDPKVMRGHVGFAGFRVQFVTDWKDDVAAFLGASYFRAVGGDTRQYGLSARALAVDTAFPRPEEFPRFTSFWFERPAKDSGVSDPVRSDGFAEHRRRVELSDRARRHARSWTSTARCTRANPSSGWASRR